MGIIGALIVSALIAATSSAIGAGLNYASTSKTNQQNIDMQNQTNAQNQYNIEHAHQIEMADLKAAGLNPVLTATGGSGAPIQALNSPKAQAPQIDTSGISSAISGIQHALTMQYMMGMRADMAAERNATLSAIANGKNAQSAANAALRASTNLKLAEHRVMSAKQVNNLWESPFKGMSHQQRMRILKMAHYNIWN